MGKIDGLFSSVMADENEENLIPKVTDSLKDLPISNSDESEASKKKKSPKNKKKKAPKELVYTITVPVKVYALSKLDPRIVLNTRLDSVCFPTENKSDTSEDLKFEHSWDELLVFLIGALQFKLKDSFIEIVSNSGVLTNNIQLRTGSRKYLDYEIEKGIKVYKIPGTSYIVEIADHNFDLLPSINKCVKLLNINPKDIECKLINPNIKAYEEDKVELITEVKTLEELLETGLPFDSVVSKVGILDEDLECDSLRSGVILLLCYAILMYEAPALDALLKYTIKDVVGVTDDNQAYLGYMRVTPLVECEYCFYTNGQTMAMLNYINNIYNDLGITSDSIEITYSYKEGGEVHYGS